MPPNGASAQSHDVRAWLLRIHEAASHRNFQGTFVVSGGGSVSSAHIAHFCEGPNQLERSESLDGQTRLVYRNNDVVTTVWPMHKVATGRAANADRAVPCAASGWRRPHRRVLRSCVLRAADRIAGHEAERAAGPSPATACATATGCGPISASGLLLRADVLGERQRGAGVIRLLRCFDQCEARARDGAAADEASRRHARGATGAGSRPAWNAQGWEMHAVDDTGLQAGQLCEAADGRHRDAPDNGEGDQPALQAIYSDGLTYVSLFIEPFDPKRHLRPMLASVGPDADADEPAGRLVDHGRRRCAGCDLASVCAQGLERSTK